MENILSQIIIVGAGPSGLMFANQLTRFGIDYIILDEKDGPTDQSRALVVQARSLEIYEQLGLSDSIVQDGQQIDGMVLYKNGAVTTEVTITTPGKETTPFPYLMMYEQSKNEKLLYQNLLYKNRSVEWNTRIVKIQKEPELYSLKAMQGLKEVTYTCNYLIACDGSKSLVRDFSKVSFTGESYLNIFFVADTRIEGGFSAGKVSVFLKKDGMTVLFPMTGEKHFRVLGILPKAYYHREDLPFDEILQNVKEGIQRPALFHTTNWYSTYKLHHKKVSHFSKDNIFFVGDAAHVHSPAGGQGMNTGLQDAYNLAWKLAMVVTKDAEPAILDTYHEERNPVAENLLKTTDKMFAYMSTDRFWFSIFRLYVLPVLIPLITKSRFLRKQVFLNLSQIRINYQSSSLSKGRAGKIKAGLRLPYCLVRRNNLSISIYQLINEGVQRPFTVLIYNMDTIIPGHLNNKSFKILLLEKNPHNDASFKKIGFPKSFLMVLRPDNYIGYISGQADFKEINRFFNEAYHLNG